MQVPIDLSFRINLSIIIVKIILFLVVQIV